MFLQGATTCHPDEAEDEQVPTPPRDSDDSSFERAVGSQQHAHQIPVLTAQEEEADTDSSSLALQDQVRCCRCRERACCCGAGRAR